MPTRRARVPPGVLHGISVRITWSKLGSGVESRVGPCWRRWNGMVTDTCGAWTYLQRFPKHFFRQTVIAVPGRLRAAWTYVRGSSRRRLPSLVTELEAI